MAGPGLRAGPRVQRGQLLAHLRPWAGVPLEARSLEAGALLGGLLGQPALGAAAGLWLPVGQLHAQDQPLLHTSATGGVTLRPGDRWGRVRGQRPGGPEHSTRDCGDTAWSVTTG